MINHIKLEKRMEDCFYDFQDAYQEFLKEQNYKNKMNVIDKIRDLRVEINGFKSAISNTYLKK